MNKVLIVEDDISIAELEKDGVTLELTGTEGAECTALPDVQADSENGIAAVESSAQEMPESADMSVLPEVAGTGLAVAETVSVTDDSVTETSEETVNGYETESGLSVRYNVLTAEEFLIL